MSKNMIIRYEMRPDTADENQRLIEQVFAELNEKDPGNVRYASFRLDDDVTFIHVALFDGEDDADPLQQLTAFKEFQATFGDRMAAKPVRGEVKVIGSYRFSTD